MIEKVDETRAWLDERIEVQNSRAPDEEPVFTIDEVEARMKKVSTLAKKVFSKKKPKEPKKKKEEEKTEEEEKKEEASK